MEKLRSRTKSLVGALEARKSIVERLGQHEKDLQSPPPMDASLAAGGLSPSPTSRSKISMLPSLNNLSDGNISPIFGFSATAGYSTNQEASVSAPSPSTAMFGRRATSISPNVTRPDGSTDDDTTGVEHFAAQPTKYQQHTYGEYKKMVNEYKNCKWGGLGPEETEEKRRARENRQKFLDYGKNVSQLNLQLVQQLQQAVSPSPQGRGSPPLKQSAMIQRRLTDEAELGRLKRERMMMFTANLLQKDPKGTGLSPARGFVTPSPTLLDAVSESSDAHAQPVATIGELHMTTGPTSQSGAIQTSLHYQSFSPQHVSPPPPQSLQELKALEDKHRQDYEKILQIKRQLGVVVDGPKDHPKREKDKSASNCASNGHTPQEQALVEN